MIDWDSLLYTYSIYMHTDFRLAIHAIEKYHLSISNHPSASHKLAFKQPQYAQPTWPSRARDSATIQTTTKIWRKREKSGFSYLYIFPSLPFFFFIDDYLIIFLILDWKSPNIGIINFIYVVFTRWFSTFFVPSSTYLLYVSFWLQHLSSTLSRLTNLATFWYAPDLE